MHADIEFINNVVNEKLNNYIEAVAPYLIMDIPFYFRALHYKDKHGNSILFPADFNKTANEEFINFCRNQIKTMVSVDNYDSYMKSLVSLISTIEERKSDIVEGHALQPYETGNLFKPHEKVTKDNLKNMFLVHPGTKV